MIKRRLRSLRDWIELALRRPEAEAKLTADAQAFWCGEDAILPQFSHWRGAGIFDDDGRWLAMGKRHIELHSRLARLADMPEHVGAILEWGCGGGANAVPFSAFASYYFGLDVSRASLDECGRQLAAIGYKGFRPIEIEASRPEQALDALPGPVEIFLCTYVFELLPSADYGLRVLQVAHRSLVDGGRAIVHIRCSDGSWGSRARPFAYRRNVSRTTTYALEHFWKEAERIGFQPLGVTLVPHDELTGDDHYAYVLMVKSGSPPGQDLQLTVRTRAGGRK